MPRPTIRLEKKRKTTKKGEQKESFAAQTAIKTDKRRIQKSADVLRAPTARTGEHAEEEGKMRHKEALRLIKRMNKASANLNLAEQSAYYEAFQNERELALRELVDHNLYNLERMSDDSPHKTGRKLFEQLFRKIKDMRKGAGKRLNKHSS